MDIDYVAIGTRIKEFRMKKKITQRNLGELSSVEPSNISHIERGVTKLSLPTIVKIANALEVTVDELLCDSLVHAEHIFKHELLDEFLDCSKSELKVIIEVTKTLKRELRQESFD